MKRSGLSWTRFRFDPSLFQKQYFAVLSWQWTSYYNYIRSPLSRYRIQYPGKFTVAFRTHSWISISAFGGIFSNNCLHYNWFVIFGFDIWFCQEYRVRHLRQKFQLNLNLRLTYLSDWTHREHFRFYSSAASFGVILVICLFDPKVRFQWFHTFFHHSKIDYSRHATDLTMQI